MADILGGERFIAATPIEKGWSEDKKYCVTNTNGEKYLLRITPIERYENRKALFAMLEQVATLDIPMCLPIEFGTCANGVYSLQSWIDGEDLETVLPSLPETEQYVLGLKASEILRKIHSLPVQENTPEWSSRFFGVMDERIIAFQNCGISFDNDSLVLDFLKNNRHLLHNCPQSFRHGDYSIGNMIMSDTKDIAVIDWEVDDFDNYGDPWLDFTDVVWGADKSPHFASGLIKGYFGKEPPYEFWERLMFYVFTGITSSIQWVARTHKGALENEVRLCGEALCWYDNMKNPVPTWYRKGYEVWDVLDANGNKTGRFHERGKPMATGDYRLVVHVWKHNGRGEWLIDKRAARDTDTLGGKWETTGGSAVVGDDSLTAALREAKEELGLDLNPNKGTMFRRIINHGNDGHTWLVDAWIFEHDCPIEDVRFQENETCEAMWASVERIREMMATDEFLSEQFYPYFDDMAEKWKGVMA